MDCSITRNCYDPGAEEARRAEIEADQAYQQDLPRLERAYEAMGSTQYNYSGLSRSERIILGTAARLKPVKPYLEAAAFAVTSLPLTAEGTGAITALGLSKGFSSIVPELAPAIVNTFRSGAVNGRYLPDEMTLYRVISGGGNTTGAYWTSVKPKGPLQAVIDLALDQTWGNSATHLVTAKMPAGTLVYDGYAAAQRGLVGGGVQFFIPNVQAQWIVGLLPF